MAYIGRGTDTISNVEVLDNLTFDGSASYTLQKSSVNFVPSSANNLLISISGVVQQGNFSVSGSTITFDTTVSASDTCDWILHYGTGLITTVADGTITEAKLGSNAVTTAKITDGTITNAKLQNSSITLNGSAVSLGGSATVGGSNTPSFKATMSGNQTISINTDTKIQFDTESFDTNSAYDHTTNYRFTVPSGEGGKYYVTLFAHTSAGTSNSEAHRIAPFVNGAISDVGFMTRRFGDANTRGMGVSGILTLSESDYVEAYIRLENATTIYQKPFWEQTYFSMFKLIGV